MDLAMLRINLMSLNLDPLIEIMLSQLAAIIFSYKSKRNTLCKIWQLSLEDNLNIM